MENNEMEQNVVVEPAPQPVYQEPVYQEPVYQEPVAEAVQGTVESETTEGGTTLAIISMVLGIISILVCCCNSYVSLFLGLGALVCGIVSVSKKFAGKGMAIAGIICGAVSIVVSVVYLVLAAVVYSATGSSVTSLFL